MASDLGYEFTIALCSAIEATTADIEAADPTAFRYRGAQLRFALERALYIALVNDAELYAAFTGAGDAGPHSRVGQAVAARLLGAEGGRFASGRIAERPRYLIARGADALRRRTRLPLSDGVHGSICFLLGHSKFLRFIEPLLPLLGRDRVAILSSADDLTETLPATGVRHAGLDYGGEPERRAIGAGLREHPHIAVGYDALLRELAELRPRCVVVIEGNAPFDEVASRAARRLGIPCVCLQQGWSPVVHNGFRNMSYTAMAVWGEGFRDALVPHNPEQRFAATGSPAFATTSDRPPPGEGRRCASFFFQGPSQLIGDEDLAGMTRLVQAAAQRFPDDLMLVREHPGAPLAQEVRSAFAWAPNVRLVAPGDRTLREVVEASRVAVSIYSTSLLEAAALGTPALVFNTTSLPRYSPDVDEQGIGVETGDHDTALGTLDRLLHDDEHHASFGPALERFRHEFFAGADERAPERIAALIDEVAG